jgi:hypothetical protein
MFSPLHTCVLIAKFMYWLSEQVFISFTDTGPDMAVYWRLCQGSADHQHSAQNPGQSCPDVFIYIYKDWFGGHCKSG